MSCVVGGSEGRCGALQVLQFCVEIYGVGADGGRRAGIVLLSISRALHACWGR